jgi:endo-1,4-beta-xylanase
MAFLARFLALATALTGVLAAPTDTTPELAAVPPSPWYVLKPTAPAGQVNFTEGPALHFDVKWDRRDEMLVGYGWRNGMERNITYSGTHDANSHSFVGIYGWTSNPMVEYFVVDRFVTQNPAAAGKPQGSFESDGSTYLVYKTTRYNARAPDGTTQTYDQYWSIRANRRVGGTVTMKNHLRWWADKGLPLGKLEWQLVVVQGYYSKGQASLSFDERA